MTQGAFRNDLNYLEKYLRLYSEPFAKNIRPWLLETCRNLQWQHAVAIPAYGESELGLRCLDSLIKAAAHAQQSLLIILLVNAHSETEQSILADNEKFLINLQKIGALRAAHPDHPAQVLDITPKIHCLLLHCGKAPYLLPRKQAVGQARKTMADIATDLFFHKILQSPLCFSTDADAVWPNDFFHSVSKLESAIEPHPGFIQLAFRHDMDPLATPELKSLGRLYDLHMEGYCQEVGKIIPAFAYIPIGGAMGFNLASYAMVRGFPKKDAAEDFYLANKLVKISSFTKLENTPISLSPRLSERVPFGTGMSLQRISEEIKIQGFARTYNPDCFRLLAQFIAKVQLQMTDREPRNLSADDFFLSTQQRQIFQGYLNDLEIETAIERLRLAPLAQRDQRFLEWFDALKILRFVNHCHRHLFEPVPILP